MDALGVIQRLAGGRFLEEVAAALVEISEEVVQTGNKGAITIAIEITQPTTGQPMVVMSETISRRPPKADPRGAAFFILDGELHREDPRQVRMEFRTVPNEERDPARVEAESEMRRVD